MMTGITMGSLAQSPERGRQRILLYPRGILQLIAGNKRMGWGFCTVLIHRACRGGRYRGSQWLGRDCKLQVLKLSLSYHLKYGMTYSVPLRFVIWLPVSCPMRPGRSRSPSPSTMSGVAPGPAGCLSRARKAYKTR